MSDRPEGWLRDQVRRAAATLDGLSPEMRWVLAFRTRSRPRPCCHTTGPNHHPACTTNRTEQQ